MREWLERETDLQQKALSQVWHLAFISAPISSCCNAGHFCLWDGAFLWSQGWEEDKDGLFLK